MRGARVVIEGRREINSGMKLYIVKVEKREVRVDLPIFDDICWASASVKAECRQVNLPEGSTRSRMFEDDLRLDVKKGRNPSLSVSSSLGDNVAVKPIDLKTLMGFLS